MSKNPVTAPRLTLSALALASALLVQGSALAAPTQAQLQGITLYNDVTIAQDSVSSWGPWVEFEAPAAGPAGGLPASAGTATPPDYRPVTTPVTPPVVPPAEAPQLIGFAVAADDDGNGRALRLDSTGLTGASAGALPATVDLEFTALDGKSLPLSPATGLSRGASGYGNGTISLSDAAPIHAGSGARPATEGQVFSSNLGDYIHGAGADAAGGVYGVRTTTADMNALRAGSVVATYAGTATGTDYKQRGFSMAVNFGNGAGTFTYNDAAGASSAPSFKADIQVTGATYTATTFTNLNAKAPGVGTGSVLQGAFTGANAGSTIGAMQINTANGTGTYGATFQGVRQP